MDDFVVKFLRGLTDHELSVYVGYMHQSFILETREKVKSEISKRNLSKEQMLRLSKKKLSYEGNDICCEVCGSNIFTYDKDVEHIVTNSQIGGSFNLLNNKSSDVGIVTTRCILCNYNPSKSPAKNILHWIKRQFIDKNKEVYMIKSYDSLKF